MILILAASALATSLMSEQENCRVDRSAMLSLDQTSFDQDLAGGWRKLAAVPGCEAAAADLIRDYRAANSNDATILTWHEGQLRARAGDSAEAIRLFNASRKKSDESGWNLYVDASIAFLERNLDGLRAARDHLASLPRPENFSPRGPNGQVLNVPWPPNLHVVDGLLECFDKPYGHAYSRCGVPIKVNIR